MALAILDLVAVDKAEVRFSVDIGTNAFYQLKVGRGSRTKGGVDWVDQVYGATPVRPGGRGDLLKTSWQISLPKSWFDDKDDNAYVQLFSFKTKDGRSPAFSRVVGVPARKGSKLAVPNHYVAPMSKAAFTMISPQPFEQARLVPSLSLVTSDQASIGDLLGKLVSMAAPAVLAALKGDAQLAPNSSGTGGGLLTTLLQTVLSGLATSAKEPAPPPPMAESKSLGINRFVNGTTQMARPFVFGIDDALLAGMIGPALEALPKLISAANQQRLDLKKADNKLMGDALADINRRLMVQQVVDAQKQPGGTGQPTVGDIQQLLQLLQQAGATTPTTNPPTPTTSQTQSLLRPRALPSFTLSQTTALGFATSPPLRWHGSPKVLYAKGKDLQLRIRLDVAQPGPQGPLPKVLINVTFKDPANQAICCEKTFKLRNVAAGTIVPLSFTVDELRSLPQDKPMTAFVELRWQAGKPAREFKVVGALEFVMVDRYFLEATGPEVGGERELFEMNRFRPFWNKVWEAPVVGPAGDKASADKRLWDLDVTVRYTVLLTATHTANGLMETKLLRAPTDTDSLTLHTAGRMKAGVELSIAELGKLASIWDEAKTLEPEKLTALRTSLFAKDNGGEMTTHLKMRGRAREHAMVWMVPTFKLRELTLGVVQAIDETGQVTNSTEEAIRFPLPVAVRVLGLKTSRFDLEDKPADSDDDDSRKGTATSYHFEGYANEISTRVMLTRPNALRVDERPDSMQVRGHA